MISRNKIFFNYLVLVFNVKTAMNRDWTDLNNNVVKGDNAGAAGAIIGGLIGSDMKNKKNQEITGYRQVSKCNTQYNERTEEYLAGYSIRYEALGLRGVMSSTRSRNVGESIDVNVQISAY